MIVEILEVFPVGGVAKVFFFAIPRFLVFLSPFSPPLPHGRYQKRLKLAESRFSTLHNPVTSVDKHASIYKSVHHIYSASKRSEVLFSYMRRSFLSR